MSKQQDKSPDLIDRETLIRPHLDKIEQASGFIDTLEDEKAVINTGIKHHRDDIAESRAEIEKIMKIPAAKVQTLDLPAIGATTDPASSRDYLTSDCKCLYHKVMALAANNPHQVLNDKFVKTNLARRMIEINQDSLSGTVSAALR